MSREMSKKLSKTRDTRIDTVEAMINVNCNCICGNCAICSGGGSWSASEGHYKEYSDNLIDVLR